MTDAETTRTFVKLGDAVAAGISHGTGYTAVRDGDVIRLILPGRDVETAALPEDIDAEWLHWAVEDIIGQIGNSVTRVEYDMTIRSGVRHFTCAMRATDVDQLGLNLLRSMCFVIDTKPGGLSIGKAGVTVEVAID